jgi:hypothetical protein
MKKLWYAVLFLLGGVAHELRSPFQCACVIRQTMAWQSRERKDA